MAADLPVKPGLARLRAVPGDRNGDPLSGSDSLPQTGPDGAVPDLSATAREFGAWRQAGDGAGGGDDRFRRLLEATDIIPWEADADTWRFTYVGPQAARVLGYPVPEWYQPDFWTGHLHPDDRERAIDLCRRLSQQGEDYELEYRMAAADGR